MEFGDEQQIDTTCFDTIEDEGLREIVLARQAILMPIIQQLGEACRSRNISYFVAVQMSPPDDPNDTPFALGANVTQASDPLLKLTIAFFHDPNNFVLVPKALLSHQSIHILQELTQPPLKIRIARWFKKLRRKFNVKRSVQE